MAESQDTYTRTIRIPTVTLTAKKSGLLTRAMRDYRRARQAACEYFETHGTDDFTYSDREELRKAIYNRDDIALPSRPIYPAITTVQQNYAEYEKDRRASPPQANHADVLALPRKTTGIYAQNGRYYINLPTGRGTVNIPLRTTDDDWHTRRLPAADVVDPGERGYAGPRFKDLDAEELPGDTVKLSTSTLKKTVPRQFRVNLVVQHEKQIARPTDDPRYVVGVDRGRNQLLTAALYDTAEDHVLDWLHISGDEVKHYMDRFDERITEFQQAGVWDQMEAAKRRRYRFKKQQDYEAANQVIDLARGRFGGVVIALEALSGMGRLGGYATENRRFAEWSYYRLGEYIDQKGTPYDIPTVEVDPAHTSQQCSRCDSMDTRRSGVHFKCRVCGYDQHADANAAVNIAQAAADA